jgi:hypothetical protein
MALPGCFERRHVDGSSPLSTPADSLDGGICGISTVAFSPSIGCFPVRVPPSYRHPPENSKEFVCSAAALKTAGPDAGPLAAEGRRRDRGSRPPVQPVLQTGRRQR